MEEEVTFPRELDYRLQRILIEDMDNRLKDLTLLVSLQETELTFVWFTILSLLGYIIIKEHHNG